MKKGANFSVRASPNHSFMRFQKPNNLKIISANRIKISGFNISAKNFLNFRFKRFFILFIEPPLIVVKDFANEAD